jgi:predicted transcriptional regulator
MEVLWEKGPSSVHQLLESLPPQPALAYNSVLTTIRILEKKGYVQHIKDGRAHIYMPLVGREQASRFEIRNLINRFFNNSRELLVLNLLEDKSIDSEELQRLRELMEQGGKQ